MARSRRPGTAPEIAQIALLLDINVLLDVILDRSPWASDAIALLDRIAEGEADGYVAGHTVPTVYYLVQRAKGHAVATGAVSDLLDILTIVPLEGADFRRALSLGLKDYEDAVQAAACLRIGADFLVTRNARDFKGAPIKPRSAAEVLTLLVPPAR